MRSRYFRWSSLLRCCCGSSKRRGRRTTVLLGLGSWNLAWGSIFSTLSRCCRCSCCFAPSLPSALQHHQGKIEFLIGSGVRHCGERWVCGKKLTFGGDGKSNCLFAWAAILRDLVVTLAAAFPCGTCGTCETLIPALAQYQYI